MDAVPYLFEDEEWRDEPLSGTTNDSTSNAYLNHIYTQNQPDTFEMIYRWREYLDNYTRDNGGDARIMMTEAYANITDTMKYYGDGDKDGAHFTFNFQFISYINNASNAYDIVSRVNEWLQYMPTKYVPNWVLGNHDNIRVASKFGPKRVDGMNIFIAFLPGVMVTYNGEEIGQENGEVTFEEGKDPNACNAPLEQFDTLSRDFERTPFQWDNTTNAGFNEGFQPWLPVSEKYKQTNLKAQSVLGIKSHFNLYKQIVKLRQEDTFTKGNLTIKALSSNIVAYTRAIEGGSSYIIVINISDQEEKINLMEFSGINKNVRVVAASVESSKHDRVLPSNSFTLAPYEAVVARVLVDVETGSSDWWKHAVFYQIYPRSFKDDTNDGIGDIKGIITKLDHLKDAGVTAAWLSPIYESPQVDQGYDISNFTNIDSNYGTFEDFDNLIKKAHTLGIKIVMDFVPNHSSDKHTWFTKSENKEEGFEDFYVWRGNETDKGPPNNWISNFKYSAWKYSDVRKQYYLHQFAEQQPDLNYRNPVVVDEMKNVLKFWLDRGIDGFRMDAVPYIFEDDRLLDEPLSNSDASPDEYKYLNHIYTSDQPETFDMIYQWRQYIDDYTTEHGGDDRVIMTEAYTDINNTMKYYGNTTSKGAHFTFNFQLITKLNGTSNAKDIVNAVNEWITHIPQQYTSNWVLGNHDNHRVATRFGPENVDGFNMLAAVLPGVLVTYNGEEIGQEDGEVSWSEGQDPGACNGLEEDFNKTSRDFERTPFQWDDSVNAGFNNGTKPWLPVSQKYKELNLKLQAAKNNSHYAIYKNLIQLRKQDAFQNGDFEIFSSENTVGVVRKSSSSSYVFLFNLGNDAQTVNITNRTSTKFVEVVLASENSLRLPGNLLNVENIILQSHESVLAVNTTRIEEDVEPNRAGFVSSLLLLVILPLFLLLN
ncbi:hypothetical protein FQR65_LT12973 [Abscondita terminalis]|nr:hypothetical protein FQR65_LT12973 [Abscondita terminalis]